MEMKAMGKQYREEALLRAAAEGNLSRLKKMARWMGSGGKGEAAVLAAVEDGKGDRALHLAAGTGWLEVCRYLVEDLRLYVNQLNFIGVHHEVINDLSFRDVVKKFVLIRKDARKPTDRENYLEVHPPNIIRTETKFGSGQSSSLK
ncbi:hypothetical protein ZWY2020_018198 [Hordeum vulgare]|nr:hypothetical protein ZWY2020_018198 [Hordeum vulgare]